MVLLKGRGPEGFLFYTNEQSAKGEQLAANPRAALLFHWKSLRRQVRIEGAVERVSDAQADAYFASRAAIPSLAPGRRTSRGRSTGVRRSSSLRGSRAAVRRTGVPRPPHWGGYRVVPERIEFWSDRPHRLHERRLFIREGGGWREGLLYP